jgi:hypothetical protein
MRGTIDDITLKLCNTDIIPDKIGNKSKETIIDTINTMYWKEWRKLLTHSEYPVIKVYCLGYFYLKQNKLRNKIWVSIRKLRVLKKIFKTEYDLETKSSKILTSYRDKLRVLWKQNDKMKVQWIEHVNKINKYYLTTGQKEKIRVYYKPIDNE